MKDDTLNTMDPVQQSQQGIHAKQPSTKPLVIIVIIVLVLLALNVALLLQRQTDQSSTSTAQTNVLEMSPQVIQKEGSLQLGTREVQAVYKVGQPIVVTIVASSNNKEVVGLDAVVQVDQIAFAIGGVQSLLQDFTAVSNTSKGYLDITMSKNPQALSPTVFSNTETLTMTLTPKKVGVYQLRLLEQANKSTTKLIDNQTRVIYPSISSLTLTVQ